jgi:hypothetical protein
MATQSSLRHKPEASKQARIRPLGAYREFVQEIWLTWKDAPKRGLTPELTGAGGPIGPKGTNIGHQNREAMANVGVRVERFVRLVENASMDCVADNLI